MNVSISLPAPHGNRRNLPGDLAMWFFILAELLVFGLFFLAYAFARSRNVELFNTSQLELNRLSGAIITVLLISGSYFVVRAVDRIRHDQSRPYTHSLIAAMACGGALLIPVLLATRVKGRIVIDRFMALQGVSGAWRWVVLGWLLLVLGLIAVAFQHTQN